MGYFVVHKMKNYWVSNIKLKSLTKLLYRRLKLDTILSQKNVMFPWDTMKLRSGQRLVVNRIRRK